MSCKAASRVEGLCAEVTVSAAAAFLIEMNACAGLIIKEAGGASLLGSDALACHPEPSRTKFAGMLAVQNSNVYLNTEKGEKRFFFQSP